jgi:tetrahydromethanopterin S-methyltransferase subunit H
MRTWTSILLAAAVAAFVGCKNETGGPGNSRPTTNPIESVTGKKDTFELEKHLMATSIKQGEKHEFEVKIKRHDFHRNVKLSFKPDDGIKADFKDTEIKDPDTSAKGFIEADKEATVGKHTLKVTATPEGGGDAVTVDYDIEVKAK